MDAYLCEIKVIVDALAAINAPLTNQEPLQYTPFSPNGEYKNLLYLVTTAAYFNKHIPSNKLCAKLILYRQHLSQLCDQSSSKTTQATFVSISVSMASHGVSSGTDFLAK